MRTGIFRVRKGLFGKSILQELDDSPSLIGGQVDSSIRMKEWFDVKYSFAPSLLISGMINKE